MLFMSCHALLLFSSFTFSLPFLSSFSDWRLTRGPTVYRLALSFFLGWERTRSWRWCAPILDLVQMLPDVLYIEIEETHYIFLSLYCVSNLQLL